MLRTRSRASRGSSTLRKQQCAVFETIKSASKLRTPLYSTFVHDHARIEVLCTQDERDYHQSAVKRASQQELGSLLPLEATQATRCYTLFKTFEATSELHWP